MRRFALVWVLCVLAGSIAAQQPQETPKPPPQSVEAPGPSQNADRAQVPEKPPTDQQPGHEAKSEKPSEAPKAVTSPPPRVVATDSNVRALDDAPKAKDEQKDWWKSFFSDIKITDVAIAFFTFALVFYTARLNRSTLRLWEAAREQGADTKEAVAAAKDSASAAKRSAEAAVRFSLPSIEIAQFKLLKVNDIKDIHGSEIAGGLTMPEFFGLIVNYRNTGHSGAELIEQCVEWRVCEMLHESPAYSHKTHFAPGQIIKENQTSGSLIGNNHRLTDEQRYAIFARQESLWVYCYLSYRDVFGEPHEKRFCARWLGEHPHFGNPIGFVYDSRTPQAYVRSY